MDGVEHQSPATNHQPRFWNHIDAESGTLSLPADFEQLLQETGMRFAHPDGFTPVPVMPNQGWAYHHAVQSPSRGLEIRYRIDSLPRLAAERVQARQGMAVLASVDLNQIHLANTVATLFNLSGGQDRPLSAFPAEAVRAEFGADWGAIADFVLPEHVFGDEYRIGVLIALHRDDCADAYVLGLLCTPGADFAVLQQNFYALTFG